MAVISYQALAPPFQETEKAHCETNTLVVRLHVKGLAMKLFMSLGLWVLLSAFALVAAVDLRHIQIEGNSDSIVLPPRAWLEPWVAAARAAHTSNQSRRIDTNLLALNVRAIDLSTVESKFKKGPFVIATLADKLLVASWNGDLFVIDLSSVAAVSQILPSKLDLHEDDLIAADAQGADSFPLVRVLDLLVFDGGRQVAAAFTRYNKEAKCIDLHVVTSELLPGPEIPSNWREILQTKPCLPFYPDGVMLPWMWGGGRLVETRPGILVVTVGDFGYDGVRMPYAYSQDQNNDYGKDFEINTLTGQVVKLTVGMRNGQGLTVDHQGRIWETEHGPKGGDELNLIRQDANYGWPLVTLGTNYGSHKWPLSQKQGGHDGYELPRYAWVPSLGISNLIEVKNFADVWNGDLLVASLKARQLRRLRLAGDRVVYDEPIQLGQRLRDIDEFPDGRIVVSTDNSILYIISPDTSPDPVEQMLASLSPETRTIVDQCAQCHNLAGSPNEEGRIELTEVYGNPIARGRPELYSVALKSTQGTWDDKTLDRFLANPQAAIPGTAMTFTGIPDPDMRKIVIRFLKQLKGGANSELSPETVTVGLEGSNDEQLR